MQTIDSKLEVVGRVEYTQALGRKLKNITEALVKARCIVRDPYTADKKVLYEDKGIDLNPNDPEDSKYIGIIDKIVAEIAGEAEIELRDIIHSTYQCGHLPSGEVIKPPSSIVTEKWTVVAPSDQDLLVCTFGTKGLEKTGLKVIEGCLETDDPLSPLEIRRRIDAGLREKILTIAEAKHGNIIRCRGGQTIATIRGVITGANGGYLHTFQIGMRRPESVTA